MTRNGRSFWILAAMALILAGPVSGGEYPESVKVRTLLEADTTNLGQRLAYPLSSPAHVSSLLVELKPGAETGRHRHPVITYGYVLEGTVQIAYEGGEVRTYKAGEAFIEAVDTWHNGKNTGDVPTKILVVFISAKNLKTVVRPAQ